MVLNISSEVHIFRNLSLDFFLFALFGYAVQKALNHSSEFFLFFFTTTLVDVYFISLSIPISKPISISGLPGGCQLVANWLPNGIP